MTRVYHLSADGDHYRGLRCSAELGPLATMVLTGESIVDDWQPVEVELCTGSVPVGDILSFGPGMGVSQRGVDILAPLIEGSVEFLPLNSDDGQFYMMNVIRVVDALDRDSSELKLFKDGRRVMRIVRHVFYPSKTESEFVFKIPEQVRSRVYATDRFREAIERAELKGFHFTQLWTSSS